MSCHLSKCACIINFAAVKSSLNFDDENEVDAYSAEAWNSGWDDDFSGKPVQETSNVKQNNQLWLQECIISLSPTVDVLAFAHGQHVAFLTSKWDVSEESNVKLKFVSTYEGKLSSEKDEVITSLLCLPLASQKRSLQGGPDWTCVVVGYSSGCVKIYTEKAELLLSQLLHEEPVCYLKCRTHSIQHFSNYADQPEELIIVYSSVVVTIDGFGLFQALRACRNRLARATAGKQEAAHPPPLAYKKWGFQEHDKFVDCESAGTATVSTFDHLVTESIRKGFYGAAKANVPSCSLLVTTGSNPYVGFFHAIEGSTQPFLTDVVHAVASKLMNLITNSNAGGIIGGLIGRGEQVHLKDKPKIEPPTALPLRFGIYDKRRKGLSVVLSPNKTLGAVTDGFGRVILFDVTKGIAVRMWKGYRDAQCGWIDVEDDMVQKEHSVIELTRKRKQVFFLVIYAPRRGILEVWCSQQGPRVAAFNVGKLGRLLSPGYTMVGANFSAGNIMKCNLSACYFLDVDGYLKKIVVPFHLALSERNSKRVRDLHLLKELRTSLKSIARDKAREILVIFKDMKTSSIRIQALENLISSRHTTVDLMEEVVAGLLCHLQKQDVAETDYEMKLLKQSCIRAQQLVKLFRVMNVMNTKTVCASKSELSVDVQLFANSLCISETEVGRILSFVALHQKVAPAGKRQVRFSDDSTVDFTFSDFLSFFQITDSHLQKTGDQVMTQNLPIDLKSGLSEKLMESLGGFLFHSSVYVEACLSTLQQALKDSGVLPERLLHLLMFHWVSSSDFCEDEDKWLNLQQAMKHISSLSDPKVVCSDSEHISPWWKSLRDVLMQSTSNLAGYIGAVVARSVSTIMTAAFNVEQKGALSDGKQHKHTDEKSSSGGESDWESVSLDLEHWNLLVKQLEDVLLLSILLSSQPYGKTTVKTSSLSVGILLNGGQGAVTDLMAVWAVSVGLKPKLLSSFFVDPTDDDDISIPQKYVDESKIDVQVLAMIKGLINEVRKKYPCSLNNDVVLANCSWEFLMQWSKNKDTIENLTQSLCCFEVIHSSVIKNGFAAMMWKSCIQKKFETLALLIEKVGKTPKERLCRKEMEMNDARLENFLDFCCELLNIILETSSATEVEEVPKYQCEEFWQDQDVQGPTPLVLMAFGQKVSGNNSVYQHLMLATVLHIIVTFQMKNSRPIGMFDISVRKMFFGELHYSTKSSLDKEDSTLQAQRLQFLLRAVSAVAQSVPETVPETPVVAFPSESQGKDALCGMVGQRLASMWFNKILDLGRDWDLNLDDLRRHYVCELYSGGHDFLAEQVMAAVTQKSLLGSQLLLLAGQRMYKLVYDCPDPTSRLGFFSPEFSSWLKTLADRKLRCNNVPSLVTLNLTHHILAFIPEGHGEHSLAQALQDALRGLVAVSQNENSGGKS